MKTLFVILSVVVCVAAGISGLTLGFTNIMLGNFQLGTIGLLIGIAGFFGIPMIFVVDTTIDGR